MFEIQGGGIRTLQQMTRDIDEFESQILNALRLFICIAQTMICVCKTIE